jgi:hypothetical protein
VIRTADPRTPAQVQRNGLNEKKKPANASDGIYSSKSYDHDDVVIKEKKKKNKKEMTFAREEMIGGKDEESQLLSDEESEDLDSEDYAIRR